ncbi:MAG: ribokinase [Alkalinema sp. CACIAM 70d]|nr:MAG: ribokinase [Alkalinema sp. CACIAM 70d]
MTIVVFGSLNMDLVTQVPRLPQAGETLMGHRFFTTPGGKGANQAVAAAKLGVPTVMVGRVGNDGFGQELLASLQSYGVETGAITIDPEMHSGVAVITVADTGENQILGVFGANDRVGDPEVQRLSPLLPMTKVLLLQLEVAIEAVRQAAQAAKQAGVCVVLDPAPVPGGSIEDLYPYVDILVPNEVEASQLTGIVVNSPETAQQAAQQLQAQGAKTVIVKLGAQGAFCRTPEEEFFVPAFSVTAIDSVAAGDAFAGGLATAIVEGKSLREAVVWGSVAGALATTRRGAQVAMADRSEFDAFLQTVSRTG